MSANDGPAAAPQFGTKKLRFDEAVITATSNSDLGLGGGYSSASSGRSALKASPTSTPPPFPSSMRRSSDAASTHSDAHVQLNPTAEVIHQDGRVTTLEAGTAASPNNASAMQEEAGEVANFLADVGAGLASTVPNTSISFAQPFTAAPLPSPPPAQSGGSSVVTDASVRGRVADASECFRSLLLQLSGLILEHRPKDPEQYIVDHLLARQLAQSISGRAPANASDGVPEDERYEADAAVAFQPFGDTVVERLSSNLPSTQVGHSVLSRLAAIVISAQTDDPEDFLWARLEGRNFSEEAATHNVTFSADGFPVVKPEDPAQIALLKDIPASSPGYIVAANLLPVLLAKKPADPISYLFYHIGSRARSSAAQSVHSSAHRVRVNDDDGNDFDAESCTSREFNDDSYSGGDDAVEVGSAMDSFNHLAMPRKGSLGNLFDVSTTVAPSPATAAGHTSRHGGSSRHRYPQPSNVSRSSSARRAAKEAPSVPPPEELAALNSSGTRRVSIAQQEVQPSSTTHFTYGGSPAVADPRWAAGMEDNARIEAEEYSRIRQAFGLMRMREELRLERLQHEVRSLARESEFRTRTAVINKGDRAAERAAVVAKEALEEAHLYQGFLGAQLEQLTAEQQRQHRTVAQHMARLSSCLVSPSAGAESAARYQDVADAAPYVMPSEMDILKKQMELLSMEQARAKHCGHSGASVNAARPHPMAPSHSLGRSPYAAL